MDWILRNIPLLMFLFVAISIVRAVLAAKRQQEKSRTEHDETDQQRRVREIQEQIRRKIAERRGEVSSEPPPLARAEEPPSPMEPRRPAVPQLDPFGGAGTLKRALEEIERRLQPAPEPPKLEQRRAEVQRQAELEEQLRLAEEARQQALRRAAHLAAERAEVERSEPVLLGSARARLLADLSDPQSLRRAFVLREVLGPPVGLR